MGEFQALHTGYRESMIAGLTPYGQPEAFCVTSSWAFQATKWTLDLASKLIQADIRLHGVDRIPHDAGIIYVVNHFTRLETLLLPYELYKVTGREVWSLADAALFVGRIGSYLKSMGTLSTKDPDRDGIIVRSLLLGDHPWIIFPEGRMVKDKKVVDPGGYYRVHHQGGRRPPHTGAGVLALQAEFHRQRVRHLSLSGKETELQEVLSRFGVTDPTPILANRTVIIPVNVTYFPMRARENVFLRAARKVLGELSDQGIEELSVEGTLLSADTNIDISLGEPIEALRYLERAGGGDPSRLTAAEIEEFERDDALALKQPAMDLMLHYMSEIYRLTTVNYDHLFATIIRYQKKMRFTEREYRNRIFLCAHALSSLDIPRVHSLLSKTYRNIIYEDYSPKFHDFMDLCVREGLIVKDNGGYVRQPKQGKPSTDFHRARMEELTQVIANEVEPMPRLVGTIREIAALPRKELSARIRKIFIEEDRQIYLADYNQHKTDESVPVEVGRPYLLTPDRVRAGIVLSHGYLSTPREVRTMAEYFYRRGYAVYAVRLKGHGTSPEELAQTNWEELYESFNRGYAVIKSLTDRIIVGGFSTGGVLALLAAARKGPKVTAAFSINAPLHLRNIAARFAPSMASLNALLAKVGKSAAGWEYIAHVPENPDLNYPRIPVSGVVQLGLAMDALAAEIKNVVAPTMLVQNSRDPIVEPTSGYDIFTQLGTTEKELLYIDRPLHGVINGPGSEEVFARILPFLEKVRKRHKPKSDEQTPPPVR